MHSAFHASGSYTNFHMLYLQYLNSPFRIGSQLRLTTLLHYHISMDHGCSHRVWPLGDQGPTATYHPTLSHRATNGDVNDIKRRLATQRCEFNRLEIKGQPQQYILLQQRVITRLDGRIALCFLRFCWLCGLPKPAPRGGPITRPSL